MFRDLAQIAYRAGWLGIVLGGLSIECQFLLAAQSFGPWQVQAARPYVVRGADRRLLDRAEQYLASEQWDDALAALVRLLANNNPSVVEVEENRYLDLSGYCHRALAQLPAETLARYRQSVDAVGKVWYERGIAERDERFLQRIVDEQFCSSWGDDALLALGELELERGDLQAARNAWLRISAELTASPSGLVTFPDSRISLAKIRSRLALVSIREGNWDRAEKELVRLQQLNPSAKGRLGGRKVVLLEHLQSLLQQAREQSTFAEHESYWQADFSDEDLQLLWTKSIENDDLSIQPLVVNDLVVYQDATAVRACKVADGEAAFVAESDVFHSPGLSKGNVGRQQFALTAAYHQVFGITTSPLGPRPRDAVSVCWSIDLQRDGALQLRLASEGANIAFVGAPLVVGNRLILACRMNDQAARAGVACYDLDTRQQLWLRWLCQANTPATGRTNEIATHMLCHDSGLLYVNTNLGAIAAISASDGKVKWLRTYERNTDWLVNHGAEAFYRDPCPCEFHQGMVYVLPADGLALLALDATTGSIRWKHPVDNPQALLLNVIGERVSLVDQSLQVLDAASGHLIADTPKSDLTRIISHRDFLIVTDSARLQVFRRKPDTNFEARQRTAP